MTTNLISEQVKEALGQLQQFTQQQPTIGLVLGSGLSSLANTVGNPDIIPYAKIPHWPASTVEGHSGQLIIGRLENKTVLVQQGRAHFYEGHPLNQIILPVRVMYALGIKTLIVTNAAGGIHADYYPGDLMLIKDHINLPGLAGNNPLRGPNDESIGPRFPDLTEAYDPDLRKLAHETAVSHGFSLHEGVYTFVGGPSYETPAELRFLQAIGADAVGMSTVPTVVAARHAGIRVLGISSITNKAILDPTPGDEVSHQEVLEAGKQIIPRLTTLIRNIIRQL